MITLWSVCLAFVIVIPCFVTMDDSKYLRYLELVVLLSTFRLSAELSELRARL